MNKNKLQEIIREVIEKVLAEAPATAPSKPKPSPGPAVAPGKPGEKPKPRRPLGNPEVKPAPKAMNEEEMLKKIVARFKAKDKEKLEEEKSNKFYVSFKYPSGKVVTIQNLPKHINDTYKGALSSIRILKGYDEDHELATGNKVEGEWFVSDKNGNPIDQNGNIIKK